MQSGASPFRCTASSSAANVSPSRSATLSPGFRLQGEQPIQVKWQKGRRKSACFCRISRRSLRQRNLRPPHAPPQPSAANNVWEPDRRCSGSSFEGGDTARLYTTMGLGNWARNEWSDAKEAAREIWQFVRTHNWKQSARSSLQRKYWSQFSGRLAINPDEPILTRGSACSLVGRRHHLRRRRRPSRHLPRPDCRKV